MTVGVKIADMAIAMRNNKYQADITAITLSS